MNRKPILFMALAIVSLTAALWSGLIRLGWQIVAPSVPVVVGHGPLMVSGFLGTVISLERAVALGRLWAFAGPALSSIGAIALLVGQPNSAALLFVLAAAVMVADFVVIHRIQPVDFVRVMALGAILWLIGNLRWLSGNPLWYSVPWWAGFLILTIAGERLELSRLRGALRQEQRTAFLIILAVFLAGVVVSWSNFGVGMRVAGLGLVGLAIWLYQRDIARYTVRQRGLVRFIAVSILSGYAWLAFAGLLWMTTGGAQYGYLYDAQLHAIFLGYVMTMIIAHAPIILPAITGVQIRYYPWFYVHLWLLQASLALRIGADLAAWMPGRLWGGLLNEVALTLFVVATALAASRSKAVQETRN